jgi:hypothetical protein
MMNAIKSSNRPITKKKSIRFGSQTIRNLPKTGLKSIRKTEFPFNDPFEDENATAPLQIDNTPIIKDADYDLSDTEIVMPIADASATVGRNGPIPSIYKGVFTVIQNNMPKSYIYGKDGRTFDLDLYPDERIVETIESIDELFYDVDEPVYRIINNKYERIMPDMIHSIIVGRHKMEKGHDVFVNFSRGYESYKQQKNSKNPNKKRFPNSARNKLEFYDNLIAQADAKYGSNMVNIYIELKDVIYGGKKLNRKRKRTIKKTK